MHRGIRFSTTAKELLRLGIVEEHHLLVLAAFVNDPDCLSSWGNGLTHHDIAIFRSET